MFGHNAKITKEAKTIKEAREMNQKLEELDFDFEVFASGIWGGRENIQIFATTGKGCKIKNIGYKYAEVNADGNYHKAKPDESTIDGRDGKVRFYIYG
jgi:hypothetical protein